MEDLYQILGVDRKATKQQIKKAYRVLSKIMHPDKGGKEEGFKRLQFAYSILSDQTKRDQYDNSGSTYFTSIEDKFSDYVLQVITPMIENEKEKDLQSMDLVDAINKILKEQHKTVESKLDDTKTTRNKLGTAFRRLRYNKPNPIVKNSIRIKIMHWNGVLGTLKAQKEELKGFTKLMDGYEYDFEKPKPKNTGTWIDMRIPTRTRTAQPPWFNNGL